MTGCCCCSDLGRQRVAGDAPVPALPAAQLVGPGALLPHQSGGGHAVDPLLHQLSLFFFFFNFLFFFFFFFWRTIAVANSLRRQSGPGTGGVVAQGASCLPGCLMQAKAELYDIVQRKAVPTLPKGETSQRDNERALVCLLACE